MAAPSLTYSFINGQTADASQVMQDLNDLLNGITDGTKDLSINALTLAGAATFNGNVTLGNSLSDDLTVTASLASRLPVKTTNTYDIGDTTLGLAGIYFGTSSTQTARIVAASTFAASRTYTLPDIGTAGTFGFLEGTQTWTAAQTFNNLVCPTSGSSGKVYSGTYSPTLGSVATNITAATTGNFQYIRLGNVVHVTGYIFIDPAVASTASTLSITLPIASALTSSEQLAGVGVGGQVGVGYVAGTISADATNDRANLDFVSTTDVANRQWTLTFSYLVL